MFFYDFNINTWLLYIVLAFTCNCLFLVCTLYRWFLYCTYIYQRYSLMTYVYLICLKYRSMKMFHHVPVKIAMILQM